MANDITQVLPKILAQGLLALRQNSIVPRLVNTSYSTEAAGKGNVINVPIPSAIAARDVTPSVTIPANQDFTPTVAQVTLDFWKEATFQMSDNDIASAMDGVIPMQASEAIKSLGNAVDTYIMGKHVGFFGAAGTAGTTPFQGSLTVAGTARKLLNKQLAPVNDRFGVLDPEAEMQFLNNANILNADQAGSNTGLVNGTIGTKLGVDWYMDQNVTTFTPGTGWVTGFIASTVAGAIGDTTLNIINATASGQIKIGDIFTVASDTALQQYVVTVTATVSSTTQKAISFYPALKTAVATSATLNVLATAYTVNLVMQRNAMAWASRPLNDVQAMSSTFSTAVDPVSGIALRLEMSRQNRQTTFAFDILGGANVIRRELGVKILG